MSTTKHTNVVTLSRDWKEQLDLDDLNAAVKKVRKACGGDAQFSDKVVNTGGDDYCTLVWPSSIKLRKVSEDVSDILGFTDKIHLDKSGKFWFKFDEEYGLKSKKWFNEKDARIWIDGIAAAEDLEWAIERKTLDPHDAVEWSVLIDAAKALA